LPCVIKDVRDSAAYQTKQIKVKTL